MSLLNIQDLQVAFHTEEGNITAVNKLNFALQQGETLGIVGESGSGKSQTAFAIMGLLAKNGRAQGSVRFELGIALVTTVSSLAHDLAHQGHDHDHDHAGGGHAPAHSIHADEH